MAIYEAAYQEFKTPPSRLFPAGRSAWRPLLPLVLQNQNNRISCNALVDSGSDHCVFPLSFMRMLGLDAARGLADVTSGVGSRDIPTHFFEVVIRLGPIQILTKVGFTTGMDYLGFGLLGQDGFFDKFRITFDYSNRLFFLETK